MAFMVGDIQVQFIIVGREGRTVTLTRDEAEHLQQQLKIALRKTGKPQGQKPERERQILEVTP